MSGLVLAGGQSRRMGHDKALMGVDGAAATPGNRLVDLAVRCLEHLGAEVAVASGTRFIPALNVPQVADWGTLVDPPVATGSRGSPSSVETPGPLAGLAAGLAQARAEIVCVLAVDLPLADPDLFATLVDRWRGESALIPSVGNRPQPLHAVWSAATAPRLYALLQEGERSVMRAAEQVGALILDGPATRRLIAHDRWAHNVNRPDDLRDVNQPGADPRP